MARRVTREIEEDDGPMAVAHHAEEARIAENLMEALEGLADFTDAGTKFKVFKMPRGGGAKFDWCMDVIPPVDSEELMQSLKERFGPGEYCIRVYVNGRPGLQKQANFSIAAELKPAVPVNDDFKDKLLLALLAKNDPPPVKDDSTLIMMMQENAREARQSNERTMAMFTTLIPALMGGKDKLSEVAAIFATLNPQKGNNLGETLELLQTAKGLFGGEASGEDSLATTALKLFAPSVPDVVKSLGDLAASRRNPQTIEVRPADYRTTSSYPQAPQITNETGSNEGRPTVLAFIREDVLFYFSRKNSPSLAADGIFERLENAGYTEEDLAPIIATFAGAGEHWPDVLAGEYGIDLRADLEWAQLFLNDLIALYRGDPKPSERDSGGEGDDADNGAARDGGVIINAGEKPGLADNPEPALQG